MLPKLASFRKNLSAILPEKGRPFVCQGSPYNCKIFIVGINPATTMEGFWGYWSDCAGYDKDSFFEGYKIESTPKSRVYLLRKKY